MIKTYEDLENELHLAIVQVKKLEKEKKQLQEDIALKQECSKASKQIKFAFDSLIDEGFSRQESMQLMLAVFQSQNVRGTDYDF